MERSKTSRSIFGCSSPAATTVAALLFTIVFALAATQLARAQTFAVLHAFSGPDGALPESGLIVGHDGNFYGTTFTGAYGSSYDGTVYKLFHSGDAWMLTTLHQFQFSLGEGIGPAANVVFGPDGALYGTTVNGGAWNYPCNLGCGTVYRLSPPAVCTPGNCAWSELTIRDFEGGLDGALPEFGALVFDTAGRSYGTTAAGGHSRGGAGTVFSIWRASNGWDTSLLWSFDTPEFPEHDGVSPYNGLVMLNDDTMLGTTLQGGNAGLGNEGEGTIYELKRAKHGWSERVVHSFGVSSWDGSYPFAGLIEDAAGNLYGATSTGGPGGGGTVFKLTPSGDGWNFSTVYALPGQNNWQTGPIGNLAMDGAGNLYGTTVSEGAFSQGSVFKLAPNSDGSWTYTTLHNFTGGLDGSRPWGSLLVDNGGDVFGTAEFGGAYNDGVVFEITP